MSTEQSSNTGGSNANPLLSFINSGIAANTKASAIINPETAARLIGREVQPAEPAPVPRREEPVSQFTQTQEQVHEISTQEATAKESQVAEQPASLDDLQLNLDPETKETQDGQVQEQEQEQEDSEETSKEINFSKLRNTLKETKRQLKEREERAKQLEDKVKGYETGTEIPEILAQNQARIAELEQYEKLHALKLSPAYKEAMKPIESATARLKELAAEYDLPEEELNKIINAQSERQRNEALSEYFDVVGASEAKDLINTVNSTAARLKEMEAAPAKALEALETEHKQLMEVRKAESQRKVAQTAKDAWGEVTVKLRSEGKYQELIPRENDPEHNKKVVMPIMQAAANQYSAIIKELVKAGATDIPKELAVGLATMVQRAMITTMSVQSRDIAMREAEELKTNSQRTTSYLRPALGSVVSRGTPSNGTPKAKPLSPAEEGRALIQNVIDKSRR